MPVQESLGMIGLGGGRRNGAGGDGGGAQLGHNEKNPPKNEIKIKS